MMCYHPSLQRKQRYKHRINMQICYFPNRQQYFRLPIRHFLITGIIVILSFDPDQTTFPGSSFIDGKIRPPCNNSALRQRKLIRNTNLICIFRSSLLSLKQKKIIRKQKFFRTNQRKNEISNLKDPIHNSLPPAKAVCNILPNIYTDNPVFHYKYRFPIKHLQHRFYTGDEDCTLYRSG